MTRDDEDFLQIMEAETLRKFNAAWGREEDPRIITIC